MNTSDSPTANNICEREFIALVAFLMSIVAISIDALLPALGIIATDLNVSSPNHTQYIIVFIFVGMALGQLISGPCSDAFGRKVVLSLGIILFMLGSILCYFANSLEVLLLGRFIEGLGVSGPYISAVSIVRDKYSGRNMAKIMSLVMMIFITVPAIAPSLGQAILFAFTWREIFLLYILYAFIVGAWIFIRLEETLPKENRIPLSISSFSNGFSEVVRSKPTMSYTLCMGICFGSFIGYLNSSRQIFQEQFAVGNLFTLYFGLLALVFGIASLQNSRFVERLGMYYICLRSIICIIVSSSVFLLVNICFKVELWMFLMYASVLFFSIGLIFGNLNAMAMQPMGHIAGIASAIIGALSSVVSLVLGTVIGQLYNNTLIPMILGFLVLGILSLQLILFANKNENAATAS